MKTLLGVKGWTAVALAIAVFAIVIPLLNLVLPADSALHLGDSASLIDLGTFEDCLHGHDLRRSLRFATKRRSR